MNSRRITTILCIIFFHHLASAQCKADAGADMAQINAQRNTLGGKPLPTNGNSSYTYNWSPVKGLSCTDCPNPRVLIPETTTYTLTVTDIKNKCKSTDKVTVTVVYIDDYYPGLTTEDIETTEDLDMIEEPISESPVTVKEGEVTFMVDEEALFPGGEAAFKEYLKNNLRYPQTALENELQGKSYIDFVVELDGSMSDIRIVRGVNSCPECDQEALRIVKMMPKWKPGKVNGKDVRSKHIVAIPFKLG